MRCHFSRALRGMLLVSLASTRSVAAPPKAAQKTNVATSVCAAATIKVLSWEGAPVGNARLRMWPQGKGEKTEIFARTNSAGVAKVVVSLHDDNDEFIASVGIAADGVGAGEGQLKRGANVFTLLKPASMFGRVVDAQGKAVAGATVAATSAQYFWDVFYDTSGIHIKHLMNLEDVFVTKTDAAGNWTLLGLPNGAQVKLILQDDRFARGSFEEEGRPGRDDRPDYIARSAARIEGVVLDGAGKPVSGANLSARSAEPRVNDRWESAISDTAGRYLFASLDARVYDVFVSTAKTAKRELVAEPLRAVEAKEGASTRAPAIVMTQGALIEGTVREADGTPAAGGGLYATRTQRDGTFVETDAAGHYRVRVPPGEVRLFHREKSAPFLPPMRAWLRFNAR